MCAQKLTHLDGGREIGDEEGKRVVGVDMTGDEVGDFEGLSVATPVVDADVVLEDAEVLDDVAAVVKLVPSVTSV